MTKIIHQYYLSTGKKNAMFTLRCLRTTEGAHAAVVDIMPDFYVCNLAADIALAQEKAAQYIERIQHHFTDSTLHHVALTLTPECIAEKRRGKLSIHDTRLLHKIEQGTFPFGKYAGTPIVEAPADYLLFFADKCRQPDNNVVMHALAQTCLGVALDKGYIADRSARREKQHEQDRLSQYIGTVGERLVFQGQVYLSHCVGKHDEPGSYYITKIRCGNNIVVYKGAKPLGTLSEAICFNGTVYKHDCYQNIMSTVIKRPVLLARKND